MVVVEFEDHNRNTIGTIKFNANHPFRYNEIKNYGIIELIDISFDNIFNSEDDKMIIRCTENIKINDKELSYE